MLRLHLILVEARNLTPPISFPGGHFAGLLWGYALDNQRRPIFEVHPERNQAGWYLLHVNRNLAPRLQHRAPDDYHAMWPLARRHFHDAWALTPQFAAVDILTEYNPIVQLHPSDNHIRYLYGSQAAKQLEIVSQEAKRTRTENQVTHQLPVVMEEPDEVGYPTSDNVSDTVAAKFLEISEPLAVFAKQFANDMHFTEQVAGCLPKPDQFSMAPPEWPTARITLHLLCVQGYFKQELFCTLLQRCLTHVDAPQLISSNVVVAFSASVLRVGQLLSSLLIGVDGSDLGREFPAWQLFQDVGFWQKSALAEMAQAMLVVDASKQQTRQKQGRSHKRMSFLVRVC